MKITAPVVALALLAALADAAPKVDKDTKFNATTMHEGHNSTQHIKTAANLMGSGAKIQLCPTGDCTTGQAIMLSMGRLEEIGAADAADPGKKPVQVAPNFQALDAAWTDFAPLVINGTDTLSASFVTKFRVKDAAEDTSFNLTAVIYQGNGTAMNGNQTIDVPAGALKFSVTIGKWPFKDAANRLRFGVELKATGTNATERDPGTKKPKGGKAKDVDRLDMGEGMYMDAPTQAVVDGVNTAINGSVVPATKKQELVWVFPSFKTELFYDPVMGVDNSTSSGTAANDTTTTTNTTQSPSTTEAPKSGTGVVASVLAASVLAVASAFFA